jgi:hypothetical protein
VPAFPQMDEPEVKMIDEIFEDVHDNLPTVISMMVFG